MTTAKKKKKYPKTPVEFTLLQKNKQSDHKKDEEQQSQKHVSPSFLRPEATQRAPDLTPLT